VEESGVRVQMRGATTTGVCSDGPLVDEQIEVEGETFSATALSVGNPHFVLEGPAHRGLALRAGPVLEHHARFPARTNVEFVSVRSPTELDLFVWERGAGLTQACGTGAAATVAALVLRGRCPPNEAITVHLPGGDLTIVASADLQRIEMVGPARRVFTGTILRG
jgi:diaminopimelate epimerase